MVINIIIVMSVVRLSVTFLTITAINHQTEVRFGQEFKYGLFGGVLNHLKTEFYDVFPLRQKCKQKTFRKSSKNTPNQVLKKKDQGETKNITKRVI